MSDLSRVEQLLRNALGEDIYEVTPQSRVEVLLQQLNEYIEGIGGGSVDPEVITAWLAENIHDGAVVDNSLTVEGAAADAKKTGNELSQIAEQIEISKVVSSLTEDYIPIPCKAKTENKFIRYSTGVESDDSALVYSASEYVDVSQFAIIKYSHTSSTASSPYNGMAFYDENKEYLSGYQAVKNAPASGYDDELFAIRVHPRAKYARFSMYTDSQIYGEFELYGYSKLSKNFYGFLKADNTLINREHGYINYNYDVPHDRPAILSTTDSTRVGIKRYNEMLTVNYDGGCSSAPVIRLTGKIDSRLGSNVTAWNEGIVLETGKPYKVRAELISGTVESETAGWSISVYKTGTSSTVGTYERDGNVYTRTFTAEEDTQYNIAFYLVRTAVLTNAVFLITLEEADATAYYTEQETNGLLDYYDYKTNCLHNLVDYGYGSEKTVLLPSGGNSDGTLVGVERYRTRVKLNLVSSTYHKRVFLTGGIFRYSGLSTYKNALGRLQLEEGHKYRVTIKWLSGSAKYNDADTMLTTSVYISQGSSTIATDEYISARERRVVFTAPSDLLNIVIFIASGTTLTDALYDVTLEEIQEESDLPDYYRTELSDTVEKVRNEITSPAIVFTTVADIHRYSSNASGVQTFTQMITAMRKLSEQCKLDFILNLGDLTDGDTVQATTFARAYQCLEEFMSIGVPYFWAMGNHDTNYAISGHPYIFDMDQCYKAYYTAIKGVTFNADEQGTDYYIDFNGMGTRLIVLNANNRLTGNVEYVYGNTTATWLTSALNTDKTVLLAMHQSPIKAQVYNNTSTDGATAVVNAIQTFVNNGGKLIMMSGHSHLDMAFINPWLSVMQDCQRFSNTVGGIITPDSEDTHGISGFIDAVVKPARVQYTASEDAWSVNIYKPLTNEFSMIRFGAGADRYFHVTPIAPTTVTSKLNGTLTWSTSDDSVATVADGIITGVATGKCAILAKDADGNYECWVVNVP